MTNVKHELTKEQIDAINSYGDEIKTLKDTVTAIRKLPGMYCAGKGNKGFLSLIREIFDNAIDQVLDPSSPADYITVYYNMITLEVEVSDNGMGLPFNAMERAVTAQHTSKNYTKKKGQYSSGVHGSGLKVTNALSSECHIQSYRYDGTAMQLDLKEGYVDKKGVHPIKNPNCRQGTVVRFIPSLEVLGELSLDWKTVYHLVKDIISLTPVGSRVHFEAVDLNNQHHIEDIINKDGIITKLISSVKGPICKPIVISFDNGDFKLDTAFTFDTVGDIVESEPYITSFCNMCPTIAGEHISGTLDGICKWFCNYMNNIYLVNQKAKDKLKIIPNDIKNGLNVVISGFCLEVIFVGQDKQQLAVPDMAPFARQTIMTGLDQWSKSNPQDLLKLCKFFKDMGELRMKQDKDKVKIVQKYSASSATGGLPRKYVRPIGKDNVELMIVEGDSAKSDAETGRNKQNQGIFPIRGKLINAFACNRATFFNNEEVQSLNQIMFGMPYRRDFKVSECRVSKIIFLTDADDDGKHISSLLERMYVLYYPQLIEAGMVYKAVPPLFAVKVGSKYKYFTNNVDIIRYIQKTFLEKYKLADLKKNNIPNKDITVFFMRNADYIYHLEKMANTYALNPDLLELILYHYIQNKNTINFEKLKKEVKSTYRFMDVYKEKGIIIVKGTIDKSNVGVLSEKFFNDCIDIINIMKSNDSLYYYLNGSKSTIYQIMKAYNQVTPSGIMRFKGLGEMGKDKLAESTLLGDRTLIRYTMEDAKECLNAIREYESDKRKILDLVGQVTRDDLLD